MGQPKAWAEERLATLGKRDQLGLLDVEKALQQTHKKVARLQSLRSDHEAAREW